MYWYLRFGQCVCADAERNVRFKSYKSEITLSWRQFLNLNDVIKDLDTFRCLKYYPIGDQLWLQYYKNDIQLHYHRRRTFFTFHEDSWKKYKKDIHHSILSFLRHGVSTLHHRQHAPTHATLFKGQSRGVTSTTSQQQTLSRTTSNAGGENEQLTKPANLSEWDSTNSGRPFSFIGAVHALGTTTHATPDMEEGEVHDVDFDCGQSSDFYSIE